MDGITDSMDMSLSKLWVMVKDREAWHAAAHGVAKSWTLNNSNRQMKRSLGPLARVWHLDEPEAGDGKGISGHRTWRMCMWRVGGEEVFAAWSSKGGQDPECTLKSPSH